MFRDIKHLMAKLYLAWTSHEMTRVRLRER